MTVRAAIASMGVALVPKFLVEEEVADGKLVVLFDKPMRGPGAYYAVVPTAKRHDPLVLQFLQWLIGQARAVRPK
jgi:LysR family glycine cleavage system transcriptional activator